MEFTQGSMSKARKYKVAVTWYHSPSESQQSHQLPKFEINFISLRFVFTHENIASCLRKIDPQALGPILRMKVRSTKGMFGNPSFVDPNPIENTPLLCAFPTSHTMFTIGLGQELSHLISNCMS